MSNAVLQGQNLSLVAELRQGTQVLHRWAQWQTQHAPGRPLRVAILRKGEMRLVVHQYGRALCGVLNLADVAPKVRAFREWREPLVTVKGKLVKRGWTLVADSGEVRHVAH